MAKPKADWPALRLRYINGVMSLRDLAAEAGINAAGVMMRASKEKWEDERKRLSAEVSARSQVTLVERRAEELSKFNEDDLRVAKLMRLIVAQKMTVGAKMTPGDLAQLARTADIAQKIGRLALGAETESVVASFRKLDPLPDDAFLG